MFKHKQLSSNSKTAQNSKAFEFRVQDTQKQPTQTQSSKLQTQNSKFKLKLNTHNSNHTTSNTTHKPQTTQNTTRSTNQEPQTHNAQIKHKLCQSSSNTSIKINETFMEIISRRSLPEAVLGGSWGNLGPKTAPAPKKTQKVGSSTPIIQRPSWEQKSKKNRSRGYPNCDYMFDSF